MINYINSKKLISKSLLMVTAIVMSFTLFSCEDYFKFDLPEENSKADDTPPMADFGVTQGENEAWQTYTFANFSDSATDFVWDFGDGNSSTDVDGENTYPGEGTYTVTLTASDKNGATAMSSVTFDVVEPEAPQATIPDILEGGFEDNALPDGTGDGRDSWRSDLGEIMQITSSPVYEGEQAAKFPSDGSRMALQALKVTPNTDYVLTYYYTMKTGDPGSITVAMLAGTLTDLANVADQTIASFKGTDQTDANTYVKVDLEFNSGANDTVSIYITNEAIECRIDSFSMDLKQ